MVGDTELALLLARDRRLSDPSGDAVLIAAAHMVSALRQDDTTTARDIIATDLRLLGFRECQGRTALHLAADAGRHEFASWLIAAGADVNARDNSGATPLHLALGALGYARSGRDRRPVTSGGELREFPPFPLRPATGPETTHAAVTVELLLANGADPTQPRTGQYGFDCGVCGEP